MMRKKLIKVAPIALAAITACTLFIGSSLSKEKIFGAETENEIKYGDVNGDKEINIADVVILKKHLASMQTIIDLKASDVNVDGKVNITDAVLLMKHMAGMNVVLGSAEQPTTPVESKPDETKPEQSKPVQSDSIYGVNPTPVADSENPFPQYTAWRAANGELIYGYFAEDAFIQEYLDTFNNDRDVLGHYQPYTMSPQLMQNAKDVTIECAALLGENNWTDVVNEVILKYRGDSHLTLGHRTLGAIRMAGEWTGYKGYGTEDPHPQGISIFTRQYLNENGEVEYCDRFVIMIEAMID